MLLVHFHDRYSLIMQFHLLTATLFIIPALSRFVPPTVQQQVPIQAQWYPQKSIAHIHHA